MFEAYWRLSSVTTKNWGLHGPEGQWQKAGFDWSRQQKQNILEQAIHYLPWQGLESGELAHTGEPSAGLGAKAHGSYDRSAWTRNPSLLSGPILPPALITTGSFPKSENRLKAHRTKKVKRKLKFPDPMTPWEKNVALNWWTSCKKSCPLLPQMTSTSPVSPWKHPSIITPQGADVNAILGFMKCRKFYFTTKGHLISFYLFIFSIMVLKGAQNLLSWTTTAFLSVYS